MIWEICCRKLFTGSSGGESAVGALGSSALLEKRGLSGFLGECWVVLRFEGCLGLEIRD